MTKISLERYYFVLYDCALTSKMSKMALKSLCDKTLHMLIPPFHRGETVERPQNSTYLSTVFQ